MAVSPIVIGVYYDFSSVLCYVAQQVMHQVEEELRQASIELVWKPVDLTVLTGWNRGDRMRGRRRSPTALWTIEQLIDEPIHVPELWMDSRLASAVALSLDRGDRETAWRRLVFDCVYRLGRSLDGGGLVAELAAELDIEAPETGEAARLVERTTRDAEALGVVGVPSFLLGSWPVGGIQDPRTMVSFLKRYADRAREQQQRSASN